MIESAVKLSNRSLEAYSVLSVVGVIGSVLLVTMMASILMMARSSENKPIIGVMIADVRLLGFPHGEMMGINVVIVVILYRISLWLDIQLY